MRRVSILCPCYNIDESVSELYRNSRNVHGAFFRRVRLKEIDIYDSRRHSRSFASVRRGDLKNEIIFLSLPLSVFLSLSLSLYL